MRRGAGLAAVLACVGAGAVGALVGSWSTASPPAVPSPSVTWDGGTRLVGGMTCPDVPSGAAVCSQSFDDYAAALAGR